MFFAYINQTLAYKNMLRPADIGCKKKRKKEKKEAIIDCNFGFCRLVLHQSSCLSAKLGIVNLYRRLKTKVCFLYS